MQAEKRLQDKSRGKKDTQTSDARFDASFELGHCMRGKDAKVGCALEQQSCAAGLVRPCPELKLLWQLPSQATAYCFTAVFAHVHVEHALNISEASQAAAVQV